MSDNKQTSATGYACEAQQRLLFVQTVLIGHEIDGLSLTAITRSWEQRSSKQNQKNNVFRDLHNLKLAGYAEQIPDSELWRLGPRLIQAAFQVQRHFQRVQERLAEFEQRYTRTPR